MCRVNRAYASGASAIGVPGWPEFAFWTASIDNVRIVLTQSSSRVVRSSATDTRPPGVAVQAVGTLARTIERLPRAACAAIAFLLVAAPVARADGGRTIAAAPLGLYGGCASGAAVDPAFVCPARLGDYFSYWRLRVVEGDRLTIDWGAQQKGTALS